MELLHEDAPGVWTVLHPGPVISGVRTPDAARLAVRVSSPSGQVGPDRYYLATVHVGP